MNISVLGPKGTFSDVACETFLKQNNLKGEINYFTTFENVFDALESKKCDLALVPLENTLDGYVQKNLDLLLNKDVEIIDQISIPVQFKLVASCKREEITSVYGQFKALNQCLQIVNFLHASIIETESNMISYENWLKTKGTTAAIIPSHISVKGANLIIDDIADSKDNFTRFIVIKRKGDPFKKETEKNNILVPLFVIPEDDHPGLLFEILQAFKVYKINLISIMSRPTKIKMGNYNFYLELTDHFAQKQDILDCLKLLQRQFKFKILGMYSVD